MPTVLEERNLQTRIPITILTGYLGAGKTTLVNHILSQDHGRRYAVVVNEFGEIGIDNDLILSSEEELFEMNNGCVCCTVRGDLIRTLRDLLKQPDRFDGVIIETTGLADPGPVAQTFFADQILMAKARLDSVTTVVDAVHIRGQLQDSVEAVEQVAFADQILLNKADAVSKDEARSIKERLRQLNPYAPIHTTTRTQIDLDKILARGGFDLERLATQTSDFMSHPDDGHVHDENCGHDHAASHMDESGITSVSLSIDDPMDLNRLGDWLEDLLQRRGQDILRSKGIIDIAGEPRKLVFQAVHMMMESDFQQDWTAEERRYSRLVFIGRGLEEQELRKSFESCAAKLEC